VIVAAEVFDRFQEEVVKYSRVIHHEDGTVSPGELKFS